MPSKSLPKLPPKDESYREEPSSAILNDDSQLDNIQKMEPDQAKFKATIDQDSAERITHAKMIDEMFEESHRRRDKEASESQLQSKFDQINQIFNLDAQSRLNQEFTRTEVAPKEKDLKAFTPAKSKVDKQRELEELAKLIEATTVSINAAIETSIQDTSRKSQVPRSEKRSFASELPSSRVKDEQVRDFKLKQIDESSKFRNTRYSQAFGGKN